MKPHEFLSRMLFEFSYWHAIQGTPFKPQAYELASEAVMGLGKDIEKRWKEGGIKGLEDLPGIGHKIAIKIDEYFRTGRVKEYDQLKRKFPVDIWGLSRIEGLGPKHIRRTSRHAALPSSAARRAAIRSKRFCRLRIQSWPVLKK